MRKLSFYFIAILLSTSVFFISCRQENKAPKNATIKVEKVAVDEFEVLANYLETNGNFINSEFVPAMIGAKEVHENIDNAAYLLIDTRGSDLFAAGHIKNAVQIAASDLITNFEGKIIPSKYEKIVLICKSGQSASYATGIMRSLGYDNVYAMKYGMSSWNKSFAKKYWLKNITNDFANKLEKTPNNKPAKAGHPSISTGKTTGKEILKERAQNALNTPYKSLLVKAPAVFENPENYYVLNYWPEAKYNAGHIPGAIQYTPKKSLETKADLYTLPVDKEIVAYCYTGQHAAFVTGYLNMLGYDAKALAYGANSFMHTEMKNREGKWHAFTKKKMYNYTVVKD